MKFKIVEISRFLFISTFILCWIVPIFSVILFKEYIPNNLFLIICFSVLLLILSFLIPKKIARAETEIEINENGIRRIWKKQFLFHNKADELISWPAISEYKFQPDQNFEKFVLKLNDASNFTVVHYTDNKNDDFYNFLNHILEKINEINTANPYRIKLGKTFFETKYALIVSYIIIIMVVAFAIILGFAPHFGKLGFGKIAQILGLALTSLYFVYQVYTHRKMRKKYNKELNNYLNSKK